MILILWWYVIDLVNVYQLVMVKAELVDTISPVYMALWMQEKNLPLQSAKLLVS